MFYQIQKYLFKINFILFLVIFLPSLFGLALNSVNLSNNLEQTNFTNVLVRADEGGQPTNRPSEEDLKNVAEGAAPVPDQNITGGGTPGGGDTPVERAPSSGSSGGGDLNRLNILGISCIFPGQRNCEGENNLIDQIRIFLFGLGNAVALLVFVYGGFKYFFNGVSSSVEDGKKAIINGTIGLVLVNLANFLTSLITGSEGQGGIITESGLNRGPIEALLGIITTDFLLPLSSVVAVAVIMYGGYQYMFSTIPSMKADGLDTIKKGAIGLVVVLLASPIIGLITGTISVGGENGETVTFSANPIADFLVGRVLAGLVIPAATVISVFFVVWGGYEMITSSGDKTKYEKGLESLKNSLIGLIVVLLSTTIVALVTLFSNIDL